MPFYEIIGMHYFRYQDDQSVELAILYTSRETATVVKYYIEISNGLKPSLLPCTALTT